MIQGKAAPYGVCSVGGIDLEPLCERLLPGCFRNLRSRRISLLVNHDPRRKLCDTSSGLKLIDSNRGLYFAAPVALPHGAVGCSIRLKAIQYKQGRGLVKELVAGKLLEISIIVPPHSPAYPGTWVFEVEDEFATLADLTR